MYLLYCDETNLEERAGDFFAYGGLSIPGDSARELSQTIDGIRRQLKVGREYKLKFNPGPDDLTHEAFIQLKQQVIEAAIRYGAQFFVSLILHDIARDTQEARRNEINRICLNFANYLNRKNQPGLVLIDRFSDKQIDAHLIEKFSVGLKGLPYGELRLKNIVGFHYSALGQSHFSSLVDVILGSFRFVVNAFTRADDGGMARAKTLVPILAPLFFREKGRQSASEISLCFSPKTINMDKYHARYVGLQAYLEKLGLPSDQTIYKP